MFWVEKKRRKENRDFRNTSPNVLSMKIWSVLKWYFTSKFNVSILLHEMKQIEGTVLQIIINWKRQTPSFSRNIKKEQSCQHVKSKHTYRPWIIFMTIFLKYYHLFPSQQNSLFWLQYPQVQSHSITTIPRFSISFALLPLTCRIQSFKSWQRLRRTFMSVKQGKINGCFF